MRSISSYKYVDLQFSQAKDKVYTNIYPVARCQIREMRHFDGEIGELLDTHVVDLPWNRIVTVINIKIRYKKSNQQV